MIRIKEQHEALLLPLILLSDVFFVLEDWKSCELDSQDTRRVEEKWLCQVGSEPFAFLSF